MTENDALALMRQNDAAGLSWFIHQYTPYVSAIVWNIVHPPLTAQDAEEIVADVFLTLWQYSEYPQPGKVKAYLGSIARSRAIDRLRGHKVELTLEYDALELPATGPEEFLLSQETRLHLRQTPVVIDPGITTPERILSLTLGTPMSEVPKVPRKIWRIVLIVAALTVILIVAAVAAALPD